MAETDPREGMLVAAQGGPSGRVHAARLIYPAGRPDLGLTPWWSLCSATVASKLADEPVTCRNCLRALDRHGLKIGEVAHE